MPEDLFEEGWHPARLIPAVGIRGQDEQEKRATSSFLAVMRAVPEFGHALVGPLGAPKGRIATYAEVQLKDTTGKTHIPDGAVVVERGKTTWRCLVEVKTGNAELKPEQVNHYLDWARENRLDAVLTISNQITASPTDSPVPVDGRKLRNTRLFHLSWWRTLTEAIVQHRHRGVSDPDQAWLLGELIAYLDDERSGASGFQDMGEAWIKVRNGAGDATLRASNPEVRDVAERWDQFVEYLCLGLGQDLGRDVRAVRPRKNTTAARLDANANALAERGLLEAAIRVPNAVGPLVVEADLRTRKVVTSVTVDAPGAGRPATRVNWLLRQLKEAPDGLVAVRDELPAEGVVVLDDPVQDDRDLVAVSVARGQRVGVGLGHPPVRGPAGVTNPDRRSRGLSVDLDPEVLELADRPDRCEVRALEHADARRVIAAVLQALEATEQLLPGLPRAYVSDHSTHVRPWLSFIRIPAPTSLVACSLATKGAARERP